VRVAAITLAAPSIPHQQTPTQLYHNQHHDPPPTMTTTKKDHDDDCQPTPASPAGVLHPMPAGFNVHPPSINGWPPSSQNEQSSLSRTTGTGSLQSLYSNERPSPQQDQSHCHACPSPTHTTDTTVTTTTTFTIAIIGLLPPRLDHGCNCTTPARTCHACHPSPGNPSISHLASLASPDAAGWATWVFARYTWRVVAGFGSGLSITVSCVVCGGRTDGGAD
jgi:hypothetical protein